MSPLNEVATMPASVLFLLSQKRITPAIHALAHERGIMLDSVIERLDAPDSASIPIRTRLSARSHKSTTACNLIEPILDVQADWRWQKLKITLDPTGGSPLHTASSASLIYSRKPIRPAHAAISRFLQQWPFTAHGNHPENTPMPIRRRSSAFKPNSKRFSRYQASRSEKKARNFIRSLSSVFPKNTGGTRTRRMKSDRKASEGGPFKLRLH
jgi:hypothetical protein